VGVSYSKAKQQGLDHSSGFREDERDSAEIGESRGKRYLT